MLSENLDQNISLVEACFEGSGDFMKKKFFIDKEGKISAYVAYIDMLINRDIIEVNIINRMVNRLRNDTVDIVAVKGALFNPIQDGGITVADLKEVETIEEITQAILGGDTLILFDHCPKAIIVSTKGWPNRGVPTTDNEVVVQGSKEAFSEVFRINTMLIRRRIKDTKLKVKQLTVGRRGNSNLALMYLDDVVRPDILKEVESRIQQIDIDAILDSGHLAQLIEDNQFSPFPQLQMTERPDKAASAVLEGRIAIVLDNSPFVILAPSTFNTFFQSSEDYYQRFEIMSFVRFIRYISGAMALLLPGFYLAVSLYSPSMLPQMLILKMAEARQSVPFPALIEILLMDLAFELLREAGIRLPAPVSSTIGIVGGLIIGQAAVEAGLVSPIIVVIVALTGIAGFAIPNVSLVAGFRLSKYLVILFSATFGLLGFWVSALLILIHLVSLKSFGFPYLFPFAGGGLNDFSDLKDSIFRLPVTKMVKRPYFANPNQQTKMNPSPLKKKKPDKKHP